jgi:hypothetical protein
VSASQQGPNETGAACCTTGHSAARFRAGVRIGGNLLVIYHESNIGEASAVLMASSSLTTLP